MEEEVLEVEKDFAQAIVKNDPEAIERFVADDWIIVNADGGIIDKERFLGDQIRHSNSRDDGVR
jgi:ketosteroid isomerase-like protein